MNTMILIEHLCQEAIRLGRFDPRYPELLHLSLQYHLPHTFDPDDAYDGEEGFGEDPSGFAAIYFSILDALCNEPDFVPALRRGIEMLDAATPSIEG